MARCWPDTIGVTEFVQDGPRLGNQYADDGQLRAWLRRRLPPAVLADVEPDLQRFGGRVAGDVLALADAAEATPPRHVPYDPWGRRVDDIVVADARRALDGVSAEEGLVALAYERRHGPLSRMHQMAKLYLFHPSSATYSCPLAMGDGAARFLEQFGRHDPRARRAFERLTTRDPERFWTSGQWMTERTGGSDVGRTATIARWDASANAYRLFGTKWFASAATSPMAMALARVEGAPDGGRGLSVFLIELRDQAGALRGIRVDRLKDKLGTRALPTAELTLDGTPATLIGGTGDGVRKIASLFTVTRVYNAVAAAAGMRRAAALARDYATRRVAFGRPLIDHPLHADTLADLEARVRASFALAFRVVELMGKDECGDANGRDRAVFRLLTPAAKLFTGKEAVAVASEALECFGGAGYVEDTGLPRLLRDAQVLPIWEGTTNVLSLDVLRALERDGALGEWAADVRDRAHAVQSAELRAGVERVLSAVSAIERSVGEVHDAAREAGARRLAFAIARTTAAAELLGHADWAQRGGEADAPAAIAAERRFRRLGSSL